MSGQIWVRSSGGVSGPFSVEEIRARVARGELRAPDALSMDREKWFGPDALDGVGSPVRPAPAASEPADGPAASPARTCPDCGAALKQGAVLCVQCGLDLRVGKKLSTVVERKEPPERDLELLSELRARDAGSESALRQLMVKVFLAAMAVGLPAVGFIGLVAYSAKSQIGPQSRWSISFFPTVQVVIHNPTHDSRFDRPYDPFAGQVISSVSTVRFHKFIAWPGMLCVVAFVSLLAFDAVLFVMLRRRRRTGARAPG